MTRGRLFYVIRCRKMHTDVESQHKRYHQLRVFRVPTHHVSHCEEVQGESKPYWNNDRLSDLGIHRCDHTELAPLTLAHFGLLRPR